MSALGILSLGYTRGLWEGAEAEDVRRMKAYAAGLRDYVVIVNSYKRHRLARLQVAPNFVAIPTDAFHAADSFVRMLGLGGRALRARRLDLIQAQDPFFCGPIAVLLGQFFRRPVVVCVYGPNPYDPAWLASSRLHRVLAPIGRWVLRRCDSILVDGKLTARRLLAAGYSANRIEVKPVVPTNLERFFALERALQNRTRPRLLFVGRLCSQKNLPRLFSAVKPLRERCELVVVGDGPAQSKLRALVRQEQLEDCVVFRGAVPREAIAAEFAQSDVFVLTSDYEGFPRVLMEAAAAALPIVTTAVSGADEAVADGESGFVVPINAAEALSEKLDHLLAHPQLRLEMGLAGRRRIRALDPSTNMPRQLAIWKKAARRGLLLFNLVTDANDPILGFTSDWIRELAARLESIDVITMRAGVIDLPENVRVHSVGKEKGYSEPRRVLEFYRHLFRLLRRDSIDGCFSHMMPEFSALAGPVLKIRGIPLVTWYAHPSLTRAVKLAHLFSDRIVTSLPSAYPYRKEKLSVIGQGIDTRLFAPAPQIAPRDNLILCAGRISPVKNHATLLRAVALLPRTIQVVILGATSGVEDEAHALKLARLVEELGLQDNVTFAGPVPRSELAAHFNRCALHVNLTPAGFGDKVAWEAMSCGRPTLVANTDFRETLGSHADELLFSPDDPSELARKIAALLAKTPAERGAVGADLRRQVERLHSLPQLAARVLAELNAAARNKSPIENPKFVPRPTACAP